MGGRLPLVLMLLTAPPILVEGKGGEDQEFNRHWAGMAQHYGTMKAKGVRAGRIGPGMRLLVSIANYGSLSEKTLTVFKLLHNLVDICNHGVNVTIHMDTTDAEWEIVNRLDTGEMYCERSGEKLHLDVKTHSAGVGHMLTSKHRQYWHDHFSEHDWFLYTEHDLDFTASNFIHLMQEFKRVEGTNYIPGLLRVEHLRPGDWSEKFPLEFELGMWTDDEQGRKRLCQPDNPALVGTVNIRGRDYLAPKNGYQAFYLISRDMLEPIIDKKEWYAPVQPRTLVREIFATYWLTGPCDYRWCEQPFSKVVPFEDIDSFTIHHMSNK